MTFRDDFNRLFDEFFRDWGIPTSLSTHRTMQFMPSVNVAETDTAIEVSAELPGMTVNDIEVSVVKDHLVLRGEKKSEQEEKKGDYHRVECSYGRFERVVMLPVEVETDKAAAEFKNGVLTITIPKSKTAQETHKKIAIKQS